MSDRGVFGGGVETGAGFECEITVTSDFCRRIPFPKLPQQCLKGFSLGRGAGVLRFAVAVESSYVAYAYRTVVHPLLGAMRAYFAFLPAFLYRSVEAYDIMVAYTAESPFAVPAVDVGGMESTAFLCGGTVDYYGVDYPCHWEKGLRVAR